jgi:hypothetical protein
MMMGLNLFDIVASRSPRERTHRRSSVWDAVTHLTTETCRAGANSSALATALLSLRTLVAQRAAGALLSPWAVRLALDKKGIGAQRSFFSDDPEARTHARRTPSWTCVGLLFMRTCIYLFGATQGGGDSPSRAKSFARDRGEWSERARQERGQRSHPRGRAATTPKTSASRR